MDAITRRRLLRASAAGSLASVAGCLGTLDRTGGPTQTDTPTETPDGSTVDETALTEWERSTDCDGMHDSVIKVNNVVEGELSDTYAPVAFSELTPGEQEILDVVLTEGGYGTCDVSDAFQRFVERTADQREKQDGEMKLFVEREDTYYGLYVEKADQVFAY